MSPVTRRFNAVLLLLVATPAPVAESTLPCVQPFSPGDGSLSWSQRLQAPSAQQVRSLRLPRPSAFPKKLKNREQPKTCPAPKSKATSSARKSPKRASSDAPIAESDDEERFGNDTLDILEERQLRRGVWFDIENKRRNIILENGPAESRRSQSSRAMALHCARH